MKHCKICATPIDARYCPQCGQRDIDLERPLVKLAGAVVEEAIDLDGRAARTIRTLFARPGGVTQEFLAGHRQRYTPPLHIYLVVSVLFFVVVTWVVREGILFDAGVDSSDEARVLTEFLPRLMFAFLPVFALLLKLAYSRRLYSDHIIHALHLHTAAFVVIALVLPLERAADRHWTFRSLEH